MVDTKENLQNEWNKILPTQVIKLEEIKETRSEAQNRLYHKWIWDLTWVFADKWIFITPDDLHEWLRDKLIQWWYKKSPLTWRRITKQKTTTNLNKKEFSKYLEDCEKYLWQTFEVSHPLPTDIAYNQK